MDLPSQEHLPADWASLLAAHSAAVEEFGRALGRLAPAGWKQPLGAGKWTPAEVTSHVVEAYRVLCAELSGAAGMQLRGSRLRRLVLKHTVLPRLIAGRPFPPGVRAPRETCPRELMDDPNQALSVLRDVADSFTKELTGRVQRGPVRLTHAYFGPLSARQGLQLLTIHTRHHARQLAATESRVPSSV